MNVDITVETSIDRPIEVVAEYAADPSNAPSWYRRISSADRQTDPPLRVGSQITFNDDSQPRRTRGSLQVHRPIMSAAMKRAMTHDLAELRSRLESR